jgi:glycosyltransferase involved in cell wall biosynthesis
VKFSIITPSYNQGRFIRDCIESVRRQEGVECEHIVVDACSTDETVSVLKEYPHLSWKSEPDAGQTDAINKGFRQATGEWCMWLNADDYLLPGALAAVRDFVTARPAVRVAYGDAIFVDGNGRMIRRKRDHRFDFGVLLFYGCYIQSTACFYHRSVFDTGHWLDASFKVCMDFDFYVRLADAGFVFDYLREPLACFRWHESNVSHVFARRRNEEHFRVQREQLAREGRSWLGGDFTLRVLMGLARLKRRFLISTERVTPTPPLPPGWPVA